MRRRARNVPFARRRFGSPIRELTTLPVADWPKHLQLARTILVDELAVSDAVAVVVLRPCLSAAQACADAINWRARDAFDGQNRARLRRIFGRAAKCAKRLPASRRHMLDRKVCSMKNADNAGALKFFPGKSSKKAHVSIRDDQTGIDNTTVALSGS